MGIKRVSLSLPSSHEDRVTYLRGQMKSRPNAVRMLATGRDVDVFKELMRVAQGHPVVEGAFGRVG